MRRNSLLLIPIIWMLAGGCEKQPELPPELRQAEDQAPNVGFTATLNGPERLVLANVSLQFGPGGDSDSSVTLSGRGASDEAIVLSANAKPRKGAATMPGDPLTSRSFEVTGPGKTWLGPTDGIRSMRSRYQAETATIIIDRVNGDAATGRIEGKFWRFDRRDPGLRPPTPEQFAGSFTAKIIR